jgi:hypothetical protein
MFFILQVAYTILIISEIFFLKAFNEQLEMFHESSKVCLKKSLIVNLLCLSVFWFSNLLAHLVFKMKYWVLSFKMQEITNGTKIKNLEIKAKILFYILGVLMIGTLIFFAIISINRVDFDKEVIWSGILRCVAPVICLIVLFDAFLRMKRFEGAEYSLSNT